MTTQIDTSTTQGKAQLMLAHAVHGAKIQSRLHSGREWVDRSEPIWSWGNYDYRIAPDPDAEWREEMMQAWRDGELEFYNGAKQTWQPINGHPLLQLPSSCYRRRPKPTTRPWNCPEDVPGPVCWITPNKGLSALMITEVWQNGLSTTFRDEKFIGWPQIHRYLYSTDRRTWQPCCAEVEQ